jgi:flagellar biosynthesis/type III secretory pathway protein FliH
MMATTVIPIKGRAVIAAWKALRENESAWADMVLTMALRLKELRDDFTDNEDFSQCLDELGLDEISRDDRVAYINMGRYPDITREVLKTTIRRSAQHIWRQEIMPKIESSSRDENSTAKSVDKKSREWKPSVEVERAAVVRAAAREAGEPEPTREEIADKLGVQASGNINTGRALDYGRQQGYQQGYEDARIASADPAELSKTHRAKYEALERRLNNEFNVRVRIAAKEIANAEIDRRTARLGEVLEEARSLSMRTFGKPFTVKEFRTIVLALHEDSTNADNRRDAWDIIYPKRALLRPDEEDRFTSTLPTSFDAIKRRPK